MNGNWTGMVSIDLVPRLVTGDPALIRGLELEVPANLSHSMILWQCDFFTLFDNKPTFPVPNHKLREEIGFHSQICSFLMRYWSFGLTGHPQLLDCRLLLGRSHFEEMCQFSLQPTLSLRKFLCSNYIFFHLLALFYSHQSRSVFT